MRRYKRFFADVELLDGNVVTAHCANTGSMRGCLEEGAPCRISFHDNPKRKLAWSLEQICVAGRWIMVNTGRPNRVVEHVIGAGEIPELCGYARLERERKFGNSRIDFRLSGRDNDASSEAWVEVKNVTLREGALAKFPDSVTSRGTKHLEELIAVCEQGSRGVLFFHVATEGVEQVSPADAIDPVYGQTLRKAVRAGVEVLAYQCAMDETGLWISKRLPVTLNEPGSANECS